MSKPVRSRRIVALIAAYLVALQALLLLPLSVAAGAAADPSLCATASSANGSQPIHHDIGCGCAAGCGMQYYGQALAGPPPIVVTLALTHARALMPALAIEPIVLPAAKGPQIPRAPPAA